MRRDHPAANKPLKNLVSDYPWITSAPGSPLRTQFSEIVKHPASIVETSSVSMIREILLQSDHLAFVSHLMMAKEGARGGILVRPLDKVSARQSVGFTRRCDDLPTPTQHLFLEILADEARKLVA